MTRKKLEREKQSQRKTAFLIQRTLLAGQP